MRKTLACKVNSLLTTRHIQQRFLISNAYTVHHRDHLRFSRRIGSYDSLQQSINSTFSSDSIRRFKSSSFDLSPTHDTSLNRSFTFANNDRLKNASKVTKAEASKYKLYPDYSIEIVPRHGLKVAVPVKVRKKSGQSKNSKSKVLKKNFKLGWRKQTSSQLRKERQREQIEKKLKEKHGWKKTSMEQQYEVGLESQYVSLS